jgi:signal transduction histidine kinase
MAGIGCVLLAITLFFFMTHRRARLQLPYHDSFQQHSAREWIPMGGSWRIQDDAMINWSNAQGSKLITGSPQWSDYQVSSDLRLLAHGGDVGLIVRVNDPEIGTDSYHGYYVGLRSSDSALVIGRANHSWLSDRPVPFGEPIQSGRWYHLRVVSVGCTIAVEAIDPATGVRGYSAMRDDSGHCILRGQVGLRSTDTSSAWKNVHIETATEADLQQLLSKAPEVLHPDFPIREDDFTRMIAQYFPDLYQASQEEATRVVRGLQPGTAHVPLHALPLASALSLRTEPRTGKTVRLHGIVTFISPVYLQDSSGGVQLRVPDPGALSIGDVIEVAGQPAGEGRNLVFVATEVQIPSERAPLTPAAITPAQAVSGTFEGSLIEINGMVVGRRRLPDGSIALKLESDLQTFEALLQPNPFGATDEGWPAGSTIRIRGICTISPDEASGSSFAVLVQANSDVTLLAGPSWLAGWRLLFLVYIGLLMTALCVYLFMRSERAKSNAISQERERLSHEMHDTLAQSFAGVSYHLQGLRKLAREEHGDAEPLVHELDVAYQMVAGTHREASALIAALHPDANKQDDLLTLIEHATTQMLDRGGPLLRLHREGDPRSLKPASTDVLFRVGLEAVANILRHSQATAIDLSMMFTPSTITLVVADNGVGFTLNAAQLGFGLQTMYRRCASIGATLDVKTQSGAGTTVSATLRDRPARWFIFRTSRAIRKAQLVGD